MFLLPESIKKIESKTTKKRWKHHFPHHKTMGVFLDIQVQITPYYVVLSGRNSNFSYILCMSLIPTNLKWIGLIQSEKKWKHGFFRRLRAANSVVRCRIWPNFKLIQALIYVFVVVVFFFVFFFYFSFFLFFFFFYFFFCLFLSFFYYFVFLIYIFFLFLIYL